MKLTIQVNWTAPRRDAVICRWLGQQLRRIARLAGVKAGVISIAVVDDAAMVELHRRYHGQATTTDVLSFDLREAPEAPEAPDAPHAHAGLDAELVLCVDQAARQARARGHALRLELLLYAVHGLLHGLGHDDRTAPQAAAMHAREDELLTQAGLGPVFSRGKV
ncbi:MAG: rRNA maturation RNase YbeY [Phycisphaeraceae bacterium]